MQEGKTIGQLMEEMRQKAGAQNWSGIRGELYPSDFPFLFSDADEESVP